MKTTRTRRHFSLLGMAVMAMFFTQAKAEMGLLERYEFVMDDFETAESVGRWYTSSGEGTLAFELDPTWATRGRNSLRITFKGGSWPNLNASAQSMGDRWPNFAEFEYFEVDMRNPADHPAPTQASGPHGLLFFTVEGGTGTMQYRMGPRESYTFRISIRDRLGLDGLGRPIDLSKINRFHFYAWNPVVSYERQFDNIRLTRDLGRHVRGVSEALALAEMAGFLDADKPRLHRMQEEVEARFSRMPFSQENMQEFLREMSGVQDALLGALTIPDHFHRQIRLLTETDMPAEESVRGLQELRQSLQERMSRLERIRTARNLHPSKEGVLAFDGTAGPVRDDGGAHEYQMRALDQMEAAIRIMDAQIANLAHALPYVAPERAFAVGWEHPSTFVKPYGTVFGGGFDGANLAGARNETVGLQMVVMAFADDLADVRLEIKASDPILQSAARVMPVGFVGLGPRQAPESALHRLQWHPDILYPMPEEGLAVRPYTLQPFLLEVATPRDMAAGVYELAVEVSANGVTHTLPVTFEVYDFDVPFPLTFSTTTHARFLPDRALALKYGLQPGEIYSGWMRVRADVSSIREKYDLGQRLFNLENHGGAHMQLPDGWIENRYTSFFEAMDQAGIPRDSFFIYGFDEVGVQQQPAIAAHVERVRKHWNIPVMGTPMRSGWAEMPVETFDIWAGGVRYGTPEQIRNRIAKIHAINGQVWWYDNDLGFSPDLWNARHKGWEAYYWNMDGYLIYTTNSWTQRDERRLDVETLPYSNWHETRLDARGASCGLLYYEDAQEGPHYISFRLWNFRAGLYDYEYLRLLRKRVEHLRERHGDIEAEPAQDVREAETLLQLDERFAQPTDWELFEERRRRIGHMLQSL